MAYASAVRRLTVVTVLHGVNVSPSPTMTMVVPGVTNRNLFNVTGVMRV